MIPHQLHYTDTGLTSPYMMNINQGSNKVSIIQSLTPEIEQPTFRVPGERSTSIGNQEHYRGNEI